MLSEIRDAYLCLSFLFWVSLLDYLQLSLLIVFEPFCRYVFLASDGITNFSEARTTSN